MRYRWPERIGHVADGDRIIVVLLPDGVPKALDGSGAAIWQLADRATAEEIAADLGEAYGTDPAAILPGVREFCEELTGLGLLERD